MNRLILLFGFLVLASHSFGQDTREILQSYLQERHPAVFSDPYGFRISSETGSKKQNIKHLYLQQTWRGLDVFNAISVAAIRDKKVVHFSKRVVEGVQIPETPSLTPENAIRQALGLLGIESLGMVVQTRHDPLLHRYEFDAKAVSKTPVVVTLVVREKQQTHFLCWNVNLQPLSGKDWWNIRINALTGEEVDRNNWNISESFHLDHHNPAKPRHYQDPAGAKSLSGSYNVYAFPVESPNFGARSTLSSPAAPLASPFGWHDINGQAGAEFTITRGNNVHAYEDINDDDNPGYAPDGGSALTFNYPLNLSSQPSANIDAAITNLFYANNRIHDVLHRLGFDEESGNFQENNYGNGGLGNDYVEAQAQDGGGTNNANFATPDDGSTPRMQMYIWADGTNDANLFIQSPSSISGSYSITAGGFSPPINAPITAQLVLMTDSVAPVNNACEGLVNGPALNGKIAVVDRGTCTFISKVQLAEANGALAVIVINNTTGIITMGGSGSVGIPAVMISQADGNNIKAQLTAGQSVQGTLNPISFTGSVYDCSFDNGVIAHEYGHGVSNRLTGGPSNSSCLINEEQGGEGWSDWLALVLTIEPGDVGTTGRGIGTWVADQGPNSVGIRRVRYSTNPAINNQTYGDLAFSSGVHQVGEIICCALWDLTWQLIQAEGFDSDWINGTGGNHIAVELVLEGMKLQPCEPGYLDVRDAILAADSLLYNGAHACLIWNAFAGRGMGVNAIQGDFNVVGDETENFNLPWECGPLGTSLSDGDTFLDMFPNPANDEFSLMLKGDIHESVSVTLFSADGRLVSEWNTQGRPLIRFSLNDVAAGSYTVRIREGHHLFVRKLIVSR